MFDAKTLTPLSLQQEVHNFSTVKTPITIAKLSELVLLNLSIQNPLQVFSYKQVSQQIRRVLDYLLHTDYYNLIRIAPSKTQLENECHRHLCQLVRNLYKDKNNFYVTLKHPYGEVLLPLEAVYGLGIPEAEMQQVFGALQFEVSGLLHYKSKWNKVTKRYLSEFPDDFKKATTV